MLSRMSLEPPALTELRPEDRAAIERVSSALGATSPDQLDVVWQAHWHWPALFDANQRQLVEGLRRDTSLPSVTRETMYVAVSMASGCRHCIDVHSSILLRHGVGNRGLTEVLAVAEHVSSLCAAAAALRLAADVPHSHSQRNSTVGHAPGGSGDPTLEGIAGWTAEHLGTVIVPDFWRSLAHLPAFLEATWAKDRLVFSEGRIDVTSKAFAAFAVASARQSDYWIAYFAQMLRKLGVPDAGLVEATATTMHHVSMSVIAQSAGLPRT